jgi:hypothetical protein
MKIVLYHNMLLKVLSPLPDVCKKATLDKMSHFVECKRVCKGAVSTALSGANAFYDDAGKVCIEA